MFQSTRPRGARHGELQFGECLHTFQSTRPRGARPKQFKSFCPLKSFNPRARGGRDAEKIKDKQISKPFQSTRPRGARRSKPAITCQGNTFQSTRPRGARRYSHLWPERSLPFQSTRPRGARRYKMAAEKIKASFNPRARGGRDKVFKW